MEIYADNAATTKLSSSALEEMLPYYESIYGNPSSSHTAGRKAARAVKDARADIAGCLGCLPEEIIFTSGGTESDEQALISAAEEGKRNGKTHIVSTAIEHHAVLNTLEHLRKQGFSVTLLPVGSDGIVSVQDVMRAVRTDTCLVSVMYVNNEIGTIQPISDIGKLCREKKIPFHTDAVAAAAHIKIDVKAQDIDMLSLSAHKFHGPKGTGVLYVRKGLPVTPLIRGGGQERGRRAGTENVPAVVGMACALKEVYRNIDKNSARLARLGEMLINGLKAVPHSALNGSTERVAGNVNFCFEGIEGESLLLLLDSKGIYASSGSACTSMSDEPSHVLRAIGRDDRLAGSSLRISLGDDASEEEVSYIIDNVTRSVEYLRGMSQEWKDKTAGKLRFLL